MKSKFIIISIILLIVANISIMYFKTYEGFGVDVVTVARDQAKLAVAAANTAKTAATAADKAMIAAKVTVNQATNNVNIATLKANKNKANPVAVSNLKAANAAKAAANAKLDQTTSAKKIADSNAVAAEKDARDKTKLAENAAAKAKSDNDKAARDKANQDNAKVNNARTDMQNKDNAAAAATAKATDASNAIANILPGLTNIDKGVALNAYMTANDANIIASDAYNTVNNVVRKKGTIVDAVAAGKTVKAATDAKNATDAAILIMLPGLDNIKKGLAVNASNYTSAAVTAANSALTAANQDVNNKALPLKAATAAHTAKQKTSDLLNYFNNLIGLKAANII